jgi:DNA-binding response OmpR family regulator
MTLNVLVVSDSLHPTIGGFVCAACRIGKKDVNHVHSGQVALEELAKTPYDIVVLDEDLGPHNPDPLEVAREIKEKYPGVVLHILKGGIEDLQEGPCNVDFLVPKRHDWIGQVYSMPDK